MTTIPHEGLKLVRKTFAINSVTLGYLKDLQSHFKLKKLRVANRLMEILFNDANLQKQFLKYSRSFIQIKSNDLVKKGITGGYVVNEDILDKLDKMKFDFGFDDRTKFMRCLVSFFYDKYFASGKELQSEIDKVSTKIAKMGYSIEKTGILEGDIFIYLKPSK